MRKVLALLVLSALYLSRSLGLPPLFRNELLSPRPRAAKCSPATAQWQFVNFGHSWKRPHFRQVA